MTDVDENPDLMLLIEHPFVIVDVMFADLFTTWTAATDAAVDARARQVELQIRALQAEQAALTAANERRGTYRADGHRSITGYLRATFNHSGVEAGRLRRLATVCAEVPALGDALAAGRVGIAQILEIARIHTNPRTRPMFAAVAPILLERAEHAPHAELRDDVTSFVNLADQDGAYAELVDAVEQRRARMSVVEGTLDVAVTGGDTLVADEVVATFDWFCQREFERDVQARRAQHGDRADQHPLPRSDRQRRYDADIAMVRAARAHGDGAAPAKVTINVVADPDTMNDALTDATLTVPTHDGDETIDLADHHDILTTAAADPARWIERRCHTSTGTPLHPVLLARAALTAHIRRVIIDADNVVIDAGREQRLFTGPARTVAQLLTPRCTHPGCLIRCTHADIDHITEWQHHGPTNQDNADIGCRTHNRFKTRQRWRTRRDTTGRKFRLRPDGTVVLPVGARQPTFPAEPAA